jgi:hypothetical protein
MFGNPCHGKLQQQKETKHATTWVNFQRITLRGKKKSENVITVCFHLYNILDMTMFWKWQVDMMPGIKEKMEAGGK